MPQARPAPRWNAVASLSFPLHLVSRSLSPGNPQAGGLSCNSPGPLLFAPHGCEGRLPSL